MLLAQVSCTYSNLIFPSRLLNHDFAFCLFPRKPLYNQSNAFLESVKMIPPFPIGIFFYMKRATHKEFLMYIFLDKRPAESNIPVFPSS